MVVSKLRVCNYRRLQEPVAAAQVTVDTVLSSYAEFGLWGGGLCSTT